MAARCGRGSYWPTVHALLCLARFGVPTSLAAYFLFWTSRLSYTSLTPLSRPPSSSLAAAYQASSSCPTSTHLADCFPYGEGDAKKKTYLILGTMTGFHVWLLLLFKAYFFSYK